MKSNTGLGRSETEEERRLLVFRAAELSARSENCAVASSFLTSMEQRIVYESQKRETGAGNLFFWGGYVGAERRRAIYLPPWIQGESAPPENAFSEERERFFVNLLEETGSFQLTEEFVLPLSLSGSGFATLTHRDWLGALMSLGLKRNFLGDIAVGENGQAYLFCDTNCADFISTELQKAGRDKVSAEKTILPPDFVPKRSFREITFTVASPRADGILRGLCGATREKAAQMAEDGTVQLNYLPLTAPDKKITAGDVLSVRGHGKFIIDKAQDETKKGRIRVVARKYE